MRRHSRTIHLFFGFLLSSLLLAPNRAIAIRGAEDEIQDFTVAERAFQDRHYEFASHALEAFLEYYPRSEQFAQAKLLLGRAYLELGKRDEALLLFSELEKENPSLKDQLLYWSAETHLRQKDFKKAHTLYQKVTEAYPESSMVPYALYSLALCQEGEAKFEEAEAGYQKFLSRFPDHPLAEEASVRRIVSFLRQRKWDEALNPSQLFVESHPNSPWKGQVFYLRGEVFFEKGDFPQAIRMYEASLGEKEEGPWRTWARLNLGWSYFKNKEVDKALPLFKELAVDPSVRDSALFGTALSYRFQGKEEEALISLNQLLEISTERSWQNQAMLEKAKIHYKLSRIPEASATYREILSNSPTLGEATKAHYGLGWALLREGKEEEAIGEFQWVAQRASDITLRVQALCRIGDIFQDQRNIQQALDHYRLVLKDYPYAVEADYAAYQIPMTYFQAGEFLEAGRALEDFLSKFPNSNHRFQARYDLGMTHFHLGNFELAKTHFQKLVETRPHEDLYFLSLFQIGNCSYNLKEYENALKAFQEVGAEGPDPLAAPARYEKGWCLYQMGKRKEALASFQEYLDKYPNSDIAPDIHFWFAEYYERKKDYSKAEKSFENLVTKFPKSELVDEALFRWSGVASERKAYDRAARLLDDLLERYPESSLAGDALFQKSELLFLTDQKEEARRLLDEILTKFSNSPLEKRAARRIGEFLKEEGHFEEAIAYLKRAKTGDAYEPNAQIQFEIGECFEALGQEEKALESFLQLSQVYPKSTYWVTRSYLKIGTLFEKQGRWQEAVQTYEKLVEWRRLEEADVARERLRWIHSQVLRSEKTP